MATSQRSGGGRDFWICGCNDKLLGAVEYAHDNNNYCDVSVNLDHTERINKIDIYVRCYD